jgi:NinB protein
MGQTMIAKSFVLREPEHARSLWQFLKEHAAEWAAMGKPLAVKVSEHADKRTNDQNAKFHAICTDIARSGYPWAGKRRSAAEWKVLLVSGHSVATKQGAEIVPGLEGEFVNIRESTASMSVKRGASLIEYTLAWCADHGIEVKEFHAPSPAAAGLSSPREALAGERFLSGSMT